MRNNLTYRFIYLIATTLISLVLTTAVVQAAAFDGTWKVVPSPSPGRDESVLTAVATISANDLWSVGWDTHGGGIMFKPLTEHWDGTSWSVFSSPNPQGCSELDGVAAASSSDVWAVGSSSPCHSETGVALIEHWDGTRWRVSSTLTEDSFLNGAAVVSASDVWAVGGYASLHKLGTPLIEHWDGTSWSIISSPGLKGGDLDGVTAIATNDVWAVGYNKQRTLIEHWDGSQWSIVPSPSSGILRGVAAVSSTDVWAVGGDSNGTLIEHWDGTSWSVVSSPGAGALNAVAVVSANDIWAVGLNNGALIDHWDGSQWSVFPSPNPYASYLLGVAAVSANDAWAVGEYGKPNNYKGKSLTEQYS